MWCVKIRHFSTQSLDLSPIGKGESIECALKRQHWVLDEKNTVDMKPFGDFEQAQEKAMKILADKNYELRAAKRFLANLYDAHWYPPQTMELHTFGINPPYMQKITAFHEEPEDLDISIDENSKQ